MGYYTRYKLKIRDVDKDKKINTTLQHEILTKLYGIYGGYKNPIGITYFEQIMPEECKWYDHREHMTKLSKLYPNVLLELTGEGEDPGDLWKEYYKNGKMQFVKAQIIYEEFDESKLK